MLEEPYLDNEVRLIYLRCIEGHETFDRAVLIDMERGRPEIYQAYLATFDVKKVTSFPPMMLQEACCPRATFNFVGWNGIPSPERACAAITIIWCPCRIPPHPIIISRLADPLHRHGLVWLVK
jgi:hypothetical protein